MWMFWRDCVPPFTVKSVNCWNSFPMHRQIRLPIPNKIGNRTQYTQKIHTNFAIIEIDMYRYQHFSVFSYKMKIKKTTTVKRCRIFARLRTDAKTETKFKFGHQSPTFAERPRFFPRGTVFRIAEAFL